MPAGQVTRLLQQMNSQHGDARRRTYDEIVELVYEDLRRRARGQLRGERADSLRATAIVSETYERMLDYKVAYNDSTHFLNIAATAMRRYLIDRARRAKAAKRGGGRAATTLKDGTASAILAADPALLLDVERAMLTLDPAEQELTELRFFVGFTNDEVAKRMSVSEETIKVRWRVTRAKLLKALKEWQTSGACPVE